MNTRKKLQIKLNLKIVVSFIIKFRINLFNKTTALISQEYRKRKLIKLAKTTVMSNLKQTPPPLAEKETLL